MMVIRRIIGLVCLLLYLHGHSALHIYKTSRGGKPFYYQDEDGRVMEVRRPMRSGFTLPPVKRQCECYCLVAGDEATIHCCIECHVTDSVCFPASAYVRDQNGDVIKMSDLKIGDTILTASESAQVQTTEVLGFLTYDTEVIGSYRKLSVESRGFLLLSRSHLVYVSDTRTTLYAKPKFAADVRVGQYLLVRKGDDVIAERVTSIQVEAHKGAYVPLTSHGTLFVNDVKASSYAAFPHDVTHNFMFPLRWVPFLASYMSPVDGDSPYVTFLKSLGDFIMPQRRFKSTPSQNVTVNESLESKLFYESASKYEHMPYTLTNELHES